MIRKFGFSVTLCLIISAAFLLSMGAINALFVEASAPVHEIPPIIRLHVIPHSDRPADQDLKLRVRNDVLALLSEIALDTDRSSLSQALANLEMHLPELKSKVENRLALEQVDQPVTVELGVNEYDERTYLGSSVPAGKYIALEVTLGDGRGQNFWCVIFPTMCFVPDEVQALGENQVRGSVAEAAEPGRAEQQISSTALQFRWRIWERLTDSRAQHDMQEQVTGDKMANQLSPAFDGIGEQP